MLVDCVVCIDTVIVAAAHLHHDNRWSWQGKNYPRGFLDHILISPGLLPFVETVDLGASSEASDHRKRFNNQLLGFLLIAHIVFVSAA